MNVVFLGPTLPLEKARALCDAVYLPPARRGDVLAAILEHRPTAIALIDGYFDQVPSVWHKELLFALDQGVSVTGAASMGALRAAELRAFGMIGVGRVFEAYATGRFSPFDTPFEDDDEVAVAHGPAETGYASTDAMVDIRATLANAVEENVLTNGAAVDIAAAAKALFYKDRTFARVLAAAAERGMAPALLEPFRDWLPGGKVMQKRLDAEQLLRKLDAGSLDGQPPAFRFERTLLWESAVSAPASGDLS